MTRKRKDVGIELKPFLLRIINRMSHARLIESGMDRAILRCCSGGEICEALTPEEREEMLEFLRRKEGKDQRVAVLGVGTGKTVADQGREKAR